MAGSVGPGAGPGKGSGPGGAAPAVCGGQPDAAGLHAAPAGDLRAAVSGRRRPGLNPGTALVR